MPAIAYVENIPILISAVGFLLILRAVRPPRACQDRELVTMVYCGKPSRGCQMCRTRRIKVRYWCLAYLLLHSPLVPNEEEKERKKVNTAFRTTQLTRPGVLVRRDEANL